MRLPLRTPLVAALLLAVLGGCGGESVPEKGPGLVSNLLLRPPIPLARTDGQLRPATLDQWGHNDGGGWAHETLASSGDGPSYVSIAAATATLRLETTGPRDRTLQLLVSSDRDATSVQLSLNGVALEVLQLDKTWQSVSVEAPAAFWRRGANQLELTPQPQAGSTPRVSLAELNLSPAEALTATDDALLFDPHTAAAWQLELAGPGLIDFGLRAQGAGEARLRLQALDPGTGQLSLVEERAERFEAPSTSPRLGRFLLPPPNGRVFQLDMAWEADDDDPPLRLTRLDLFEEDPLRRPPILFLSIDTLSAKHLTMYGYERNTSPNLATFADDAVVFEMVRSNAPWTVPSYTSQFTGLYARASKTPEETFTSKPPAWQLFHVSPSRWTLSEMLSSAGYDTMAYVDNLLLARTPGFTQGFEHFDPEPATLGFKETEGGMRMILPRAADYLEQHRERPAFVFAQIFDVHGPYLPVPPFQGQFADQLDPEQVQTLPIVRTEPVVYGGIPGTIASVRFRMDALPATFGADYLQADYDEKILELDFLLGEFFADLKLRGLYDDLLIIFSADHGESMVDHDFNFRHGLVYDSAIHVPLVIKFPHQEYAGKRIGDPAQLVDLYPTLADYLGLPAARPYLHGRSVLPTLADHALDEVPLMSQADVLEHSSVVMGRWKLLVGWPEKTAYDTMLTNSVYQRRVHDAAPELFEEHFGGPPPLDPNLVVQRMKQLQDTNRPIYWKVKQVMIDSGPIFELFDTEADPLELHDLAAERPELVAKLLPLLQAERAKAEAVRTTEALPEVTVSDEMLEELRRLGYVGNE